VSEPDRSGRGGGRVAARSWARIDFRTRWRALVVLGLLAGLTGGFALAALSGARRSDSALARLRSRTNASDAAVFASQARNLSPDFAGLARRPEVKALAKWNLMFGALDGQPSGVLFAPSDRMWAGVMDKPVVMKGRMFDPHRSDEMVIDETLDRTHQAHLGQVIDLHLYLDTQNQGPGNKAEGPDLHLKVVGVVRNVQQFLFVTDGQGIVSPGAIARYGKVRNVSIHPNAYVQLRDPAHDAPALQRDVNKFIGAGTPILDFHEVARRVETSTAVETSALLLLFVAVLAAGGVLVGLALTRSASVIGGDAEVLRAVGMTRGEMALAATLPHAFAAGTAAVFGVATALVASWWFPVGVAARIDPDRGIHADWLVLAPGIVVLVLLVLAGAALVARRACAPASTRKARVRSGVTKWIRRNAPVTVGVGASMALEPGAGRARVAVRPALIGAIVGVLGVTAAVTINHGLRDALAHPARAGVTWDASVTPADADYTDSGLKQEALDRVRAAPNVGAASLVDRELIDVNGVGVPAFMFRTIGRSNGEPIALTLMSGRAPTGASEGTIGPATARELHVGIGDTIRVGTAHTAVKVVGEALFPTDVHAGFDQGLWLAPAGFVANTPRASVQKQVGPERGVAVRFAPGVNLHAATEKLTAALGETVGGVGPADVPVELVNLRNVRTLPVVLAVFLALLAIAAAAHGLMTSARARGREFAILRSLGLTRRGMRSVLNSQATTIAAVGLLIGVPFGVILGRSAWAMVTGRVPLENVPPMPAIGVAILLPCVVLLAVVIALLPSRRVVRLQPGQVLRTE
jgi:ABC-type lipoprotein release transport system permease subunit